MRAAAKKLKRIQRETERVLKRSHERADEIAQGKKSKLEFLAEMNQVRHENAVRERALLDVAVETAKAVSGELARTQALLSVAVETAQAAVQLRELVDGTFVGWGQDTLGVTEFHDAETGVSYLIRPSECCTKPRLSLLDQVRTEKDLDIREQDVPGAFTRGDRIQISDVDKWRPGVFQTSVPNGRATVRVPNEHGIETTVSIHRIRFADPLDDEIAKYDRCE
jgi:hypothetical protein